MSGRSASEEGSPARAATEANAGSPAESERARGGTVQDHRNLRLLYLGRATRSFVTSFLTVAFPLYLAQAHYSSAKLGLALSVGGVLSALAVLAAGTLGDRLGRKPILVTLSALSVAGSLALAGSTGFALVVIGNGLGGVGRGGGAGSGGAWGPVFPVEQPLVVESTDDLHRTSVLGKLSFVGVLAGAAGSLVTFLPSVLHGDGWAWLSAYRLLFLVGAGLSVLMVVFTLPIKERFRPKDLPPPAPTDTAPGGLSTRQLVGRLAFTNALNGLGFGFLGPLLTYWFYRRFGVGPAELGVYYAVVNLATAVPYLTSAALGRRLGAVKTVTVTRTFSIVALAAMAFAPTFLVAGLLYALRMAANSLGLPARQSYTMGMADVRRRGTVSALSALPSQVTSLISPSVGGLLMESFLDTPIWGATLFMTLNVFAYWKAFSKAPPPEERRKGSAVAEPQLPLSTTTSPPPLGRA